MIKVHTIPVTSFMQNCRVLEDTESKSAVVIDPGGEGVRLAKWLVEAKLRLDEIWLTHSHLDHVGGVAELKRRTGAILLGHASEHQLRSSVKQIARMFGAPDSEFEPCPEPDRFLSGGEIWEFGGSRINVFHSPGHSTGSLCYYVEGAGLLLAGDVLFAGSIGRTDLPGGNYDTLMASIATLMRALPGETKVLPGHGPETTLDEERRTNPFLQQETI